MSIRRVLVFPAGTEIGLEIHQALQHCKEVELFGAGQAVSNHAPFVYERYYPLPSIDEAEWLPALIKLCRALEIDYIFPAYDDVIVALAQHRTDIPAVVLTASDETCRITRSKSLTYQVLGSVVRVPLTYQSEAEVTEFPIFVKPDRGQGSQGAQQARNTSELSAAVVSIKDPIFCEYLPGEEYTIDCFSDRERGVLFCGARVRLRMRNGIAVHTRSVSLEGAKDIADGIQAALGMRGAWFFQLKRATNGELTLLEVAPRIAGSMSTHRVQGINFPLLTIFEHERLPLQLMINKSPVELDRALQNQYRLGLSYEALYIDLDDTLLVRGKVNLDAMRLIYSCINRKIPVILITRHDGDLTAVLTQYRLAGLFDELIHLDRKQRKSDHVRHANAIFLDDSFTERQDVHLRLGIATFDCSMIDALIFTHPSEAAEGTERTT
jgi:carbamoyl-phosphate synthase large subunit